LDGINTAEFTEEEWNRAMLYLKLTVELGIVRGQIANVETWRGEKNAQADVELDTLTQQEAVLVAQINALAPTP
jgi:hypothetical protein